ncbi:MAG: cell division protein ZapA, partial [Oscillospiraceae bacterium]|nr:cell division protein ZapA [Oscillospiraceae bacterium]
VKVVICGKDYVMQTAEAPNYVYGLARMLEAKLNHSMDKMNVSQYNAAVMVALSALDDLNKAHEQMEQISEQMKIYADEAGQARLERDVALKEIKILRSKIEQLENNLKLKKLKDKIPNA